MSQLLSGLTSLPPIANQSSSQAQSSLTGSSGTDLIQPVITLGFGGGNGGGAGDIAANVVNNLAAQTRQLTAKGTVLGDLGIGPRELFAAIIAVGLTAVVIAFR